VVENNYCYKRIIIKLDGKLISVGMDGTYRNEYQEGFESVPYKKIGELKDFIN